MHAKFNKMLNCIAYSLVPNDGKSEEVAKAHVF